MGMGMDVIHIIAFFALSLSFLPLSFSVLSILADSLLQPPESQTAAPQTPELPFQCGYNFEFDTTVPDPKFSVPLD
jgi:hypothetical protein